MRRKDHIKQTREYFGRLLQEIGCDTESLDVRSSRGQWHDLYLNGRYLGAYNYSSDNFRAANGYRYYWAKQSLENPYENKACRVNFTEALNIIMGFKDIPEK